MSEFWFGESWDVIGPHCILELLVVVEVEVVELAVVQFGVEDLADEFVDVFYFAVYVFLEHAETFGGVEHFEGGYASQELHGFLVGVVDAVVGVFVEYVQDRHQHAFAQFPVAFLCEVDRFCSVLFAWCFL